MSEPLLSHALVAERAPVLRRTLARLPDALLEPLVYGLEKHKDELVTGRLYKNSRGGGCAVGVMLRELFPGAYCDSRWGFWWKSRARRQSVSQEGSLLRDDTVRLRHIEMHFDKTVQQVLAAQPQLSSREAARAVGIWMAAETQAELDRRHRAARYGLFPPAEWMEESSEDDLLELPDSVLPTDSPSEMASAQTRATANAHLYKYSARA